VYREENGCDHVRGVSLWLERGTDVYREENGCVPVRKVSL